MLSSLKGKLAIVTGASTGIGADCAEVLAEHGCNLLLVARTESKLRQLHDRLVQRCGVNVRVLPLDLARPESPAEVLHFVQRNDLRVDFLINNAGLGTLGEFAKCSWESDEAMINLNIRALHQLTRLFMGRMQEQGSGHILNVASMLGFLPMPYFATYAATKAYVLSFSEALNIELKNTGVKVSALCPGTTRTPFWQTAGSKGNWIRDRAAMESRQVAEYGIRLMLTGRPSGVPGLMNKTLITLVRLLPRRVSARIGALLLKE
jgi:uncharacterized protein